MSFNALPCIIFLMEESKSERLVSEVEPLDFSILPQEVIETLLLDGTAEPSLFDEIAQENLHRPEILRHILNHPRTPEETRQFVAKILKVPAPPFRRIEAEDEAEKELRAKTLLQKIQQMKASERIHLARRCSREVRSILLHDINKNVVLTVLENPKITEIEIEVIAKQKTVHEDVLKIIAKKREWMKNYSILHAIVLNPRTPPAIALSHIHALRLKDLIRIGKNKFVPDVVRSAAKRLVAEKRPT